MMKDEPDDLSLFRASVQVDRRIRNETVEPYRPRQQRVKTQAANPSTRQQQAEFFFSDTYRTHLPEGAVRYCADNNATYILKQLRRGDFEPELFLDLHGLTRAQAKREIAALLNACQREHVSCCAIMSGHGRGILKDSLPHWLVQHPAVRAFHQAPPHHGGQASLLVLVHLPE